MKLLQKIKNWFSKTTERPPSFLEMQYEIEKSSYKWKQEASDREIERCARREALDLFLQWKSSKEQAEIYDKFYPNNLFNMHRYPLLIAKPRCSIIAVYPDQVSKFDKQGSYKEFVHKLFKEMKDDYESNKTRN